jgi:hypothetical protein
MIDDLELRRQTERPIPCVFHAPSTNKPPAPRREPPNRPKKPPVDEPPSREPEISDPEDPPPTGDPPPKRPPKKLNAAVTRFQRFVWAPSVSSWGYQRAVP